MQSEVEETLKRLQSLKGVVGVIIVNQEGTRLCLVNLFTPCVQVFLLGRPWTMPQQCNMLVTFSS